MNSAEFRTIRFMRVPQGEFGLTRNPPDDRLQAWDAADEYLLNVIDEQEMLPKESRILVLNDSFGALSVALAGHSVFSWSDSLLAQQAMQFNLIKNGFARNQIQTNPGIDFPEGRFDMVLIRIPKTLALLEHQLYSIRELINPDTRILGAGMARHIHRSTLECFESIIGPTSSSRARKKARLIFVDRDQELNRGESCYPDSYELDVGRVFELVNHASLFSRDRLDSGTRLMLEHLSTGEARRRIVDLGCGNGVLGIVAAEINPEASLLFCDESYMAVASARENFMRAHGEQRPVEFRVADCLQGIEAASRDLVLVNPPFHQQHGIGDTIAWRMIQQAQKVLDTGGELRVVGNRHLGYHAKLKKLSGNCRVLASNKKYVLLSSIKI